MEAAPRSWQFSLSNWPVTRKVGIVLVLPVLLAATFAVLRINSELQTISKLSAATDQMDVLHSTVQFITSTNELAVAAINGGNQDVDPALDAATAKFDQATAALDTTLKTSNAEPGVVKELGTAMAVAKTMRNSLRTSSPRPSAIKPTRCRPGPRPRSPTRRPSVTSGCSSRSCSSVRRSPRRAC